MKNKDAYMALLAHLSHRPLDRGRDIPCRDHRESREDREDREAREDRKGREDRDDDQRDYIRESRGE